MEPLEERAALSVFAGSPAIARLAWGAPVARASGGPEGQRGSIPLDRFHLSGSTLGLGVSAPQEHFGALHGSPSGPTRIHGAGLNEPSAAALNNLPPRAPNAELADPEEPFGGGFANDARDRTSPGVHLPGRDAQTNSLAAHPLSLDKVIVTPSVVQAGDSAAVQEALFRISKAPPTGPDLEVPYVMTSCSSAGSVAERSGLACIGGDRAYTDLPLFLGSLGKDQGEVVTLRLLDDDSYGISQPTATFFAAGSPRACSEAALLEAYRRGQSEEAFNALLELHRPMVFRTCNAILSNWLDAEDVSQFVFLVLAQRAVDLQVTLAGWLRRVARNASIALLRAKRRRARHEQNAAKSVLAEDDAPQRELREDLEAALARLPARLGDAVRLRYLDGCSQQEAAVRLGCPRGTVSQRAARGLAQLRAMFGCFSPNS